MAVTKREYIFGTFITSCISVALLIGALASQNWVQGQCTVGDDGSIMRVNFGLFQGIMTNKVLSTDKTNPIYMTCLMDENVCALSCRTTKEARKEELTNIRAGKSVNTYCNDDGSASGTLTVPKDMKWTNTGAYISTIVFLAIGLLIAAISAFFSVYNTARSPIEPLMAIMGLYIWNGCVAFFDLLVLILWGAHYEVNISENLSFSQIMIGLGTTNTSVISSVGFSYWLVFVSMFCHIICICLLAVRQWQINREPPPPIISIDKNTDDTIFLY